MEEFIVWDKDHRKFIGKDEYKVYTPKKLYDVIGLEFDEKGHFRYISKDGYSVGCATDDHFQILIYIGKKDINGKKIYADCSIVEFEWWKNGSASSKREMTKTVGFFTYDENSLRYRIKVIDNDSFKQFIDYDYKVFDLEIIDTIQEKESR